MNCTPINRCLAADYPFTNVYRFRFYHTTSHYLCHRLCYHVCLVEIPLGFSRNLKVFSRRFASTYRLFYTGYLHPYNLIVICLIVQHSSLPFREQILANRVFTTPPCVQKYITFSQIYTICPRSQFCTCYDVI